MALSHSPSIVTDGLVLCLDAANLKSYPGSGTTWFDLSQNKNNGTLINGPSFNLSNGGYISFDGSNDFVQGNTSDNFNFGTGDFTIDFWAYIQNDVAVFPIFVDTRTTDTGFGFSDYISGGQYNLYWGTSTVFSSNKTNITTGLWYNFITSRIGSSLSVYINGILDKTISNSSSLTQNNLYIGRNIPSTGTSYLNGRMASVKIYKGKGLNAQEVQQNFNALRGRFGI